jgi:hypothetical protein
MKALPFVLSLFLLPMVGFAQSSSKSSMLMIKPDTTIQFKVIIVKPDSTQQLNMPIQQPELYSFPSPLQLGEERKPLPNTLLKRQLSPLKRRTIPQEH